MWGCVCASDWRTGDKYALMMKFVDHVFDDQVIDHLTLKIILPEGSACVLLSVATSEMLLLSVSWVCWTDQMRWWRDWLGYIMARCSACSCLETRIWPSPPLDDIRVMVIVWRLRGNIIRTAVCWIVWHNVHSPQHTYVSSSYRSNRLGSSHWDPYTVRRGGCLELYYCNMVEWFWWDLSLIFDGQLVSFSALTLLVWSSGL